MKIIFIHHEPVELYKILKFESLVGGGGEAKMLISAGHVLLNGEVETQKRKKIITGDVIEFDGEVYQVQLGQAKITPQSQPQNSSLANHKPASTKIDKPQAQTNAEPKRKPKRSAINF